jgi:hypothetical protein
MRMPSNVREGQLISRTFSFPYKPILLTRLLLEAPKCLSLSEKPKLANPNIGSDIRFSREALQDISTFQISKTRLARFLFGKKVLSVFFEKENQAEIWVVDILDLI